MDQQSLHPACIDLQSNLATHFLNSLTSNLKNTDKTALIFALIEPRCSFALMLGCSDCSSNSRHCMTKSECSLYYSVWMSHKLNNPITCIYQTQFDWLLFFSPFFKKSI
ncbi:hypothetical protein DERP_011765 [Dermatophagoides pteronyssinus]|uniref:Uncharacterized protein n=1 Tax=Dermatophagoides pteronyssinus TaxID=6956 RepID=A0ABQ8JRK7_DERPT|nr:hypothetical protein DERP_011765 [Dermatophagoides pteronyssinus]